MRTRLIEALTRAWALLDAPATSAARPYQDDLTMGNVERSAMSVGEHQAEEPSVAPPADLKNWLTKETS